VDHSGNTAANGFVADNFDGLLWLHVAAGNGAVEIEFRGELEFSNAKQLRNALPPTDAQGISLLRIDMAGVTFMDSTGLTALLEADRRCRELAQPSKSSPVGSSLDSSPSPATQYPRPIGSPSHRDGRRSAETAALVSRVFFEFSNRVGGSLWTIEFGSSGSKARVALDTGRARSDHGADALPDVRAALSVRGVRGRGHP
jgi:ABC-type transporter Mla MlaB component